MIVTAMSLWERIKCFTRIRRRAWDVRRQRNIECRRLLNAATEYGFPCPVCGSRFSARVPIQFGDDCFEKGLCRRCEHLYSTWLQTDVAKASTQFGYADENENLSTQVQLLVEVANRRSLRSGSYLDFGVGGNRRSFELASAMCPHQHFFGCDLFSYSHPNYFTTYDASYAGMFDGISSYAVMEHLTYPGDSWKYLNRLLRPMVAGGGIMVHSFPSQLHHVFSDWQIQIRSHVCLFSRRSLAIQCRAAGFRLQFADPPRPVGPHSHPVLIFEKVRDV
jgi:hypothetical protein